MPRERIKVPALDRKTIDAALAVVVVDSDLPDGTTVRGYLETLLATLWRDEDGFSGKRPFGNSGWQDDVTRALAVAGFIEQDGDGVDCWAADGLAAIEFVQALIAGMCAGPVDVGPEGPFDFSDALTLLKAGERVARLGWNGKGLWIELETPGLGAPVTHPFAVICYPPQPAGSGARLPWVPSQTDMLADDWVVVQ